LFALGLVVSSVRIARGAEGLVINLKEEAVIRSKTVLLKDVADLRGPDPHQLEKLAQIALGPSPEFGVAKILSRHQIGALVEAAAGPIPDESFSGAAAVEIKLQGRQIDSKEIAPLLRSSLLAATPWKESEIEIRSIGNLKGIELPPDEAVLRLSPNATVMGQRNLMAAIEIAKAGKILRCFWITAEIRVHAKILTAAQKIPLGKIVDANDVVEKLTEITDLRAAYARNPEDVLGKASLHNFASGDPLTREAFANPFLVRHGETVQLRLERNGIVLTALARAEQDGRLGQIIRVRNLDFSTILKAQVTGRAQVMLQ
jgi:flagella basal body P-ring formation protein FlgA